MSRCFVMQPFDNAEFDRRYDEIYKPAIESSGFDPYRVDRDPGAAIPIQSIEDEIRTSAACFVDITVGNPNVWFEFGFAISALKPVCIVSSKQRDKFPFDIQHRKVIRYDTKAPSDFVQLQQAITERLRFIAEHEVQIEPQVEQKSIASKSPLLTQAEFQVLCAIFEETGSEHDNVAFSNIQDGMYRVGFNKLATRVGIEKLKSRGFINQDTYPYEGDAMLYLLDRGREYLLEYIDEKSLKDTSSLNEDIPF